MSIVFTSFKHPKLQISNKIPATLLQIVLYLHDSFISEFEFMNYLFANLPVAWLYMYILIWLKGMESSCLTSMTFG